MDKNWWKKNYLIIILLVIAVTIAGLIGKFILILKDDPGWAQSYTAVGTLTLAFFTMILALATFGVIWQNHVHKNEDRKERYLNEIIEWAIDVSNCSMNIGTFEALEAAESTKKEKILTSAQLKEWGVRLQQLITRGIRVIAIAKYSGDELYRSIKELNDNLHIFLTSLYNVETMLNKTEFLNEYLEYVKTSVKLRDNMDESSQKVIENATEIMIKDTKIKLGKWEENNQLTNEEVEKEVSLSEIKELINSLDKKIESLENRQKRNAWQWIFSLGVSAMAVGISWVLATTPIQQGDYKTGLFVFGSGLAITIIALFLRNGKKTN